MDTKSIVEQIDAELVRLSQARAILSSIVDVKMKAKVIRSKKIVNSGLPNKSKPAATVKRVISEEGKIRIAAAQKLRWAKSKRAAKKAAKKSETAKLPVAE